MDLLFVLPPDNQDSWWRSYSVEQWSEAMREYLNTLQTPAIELAGYSGGAEFIGRHLTLADTGWVPDNTSFTMIGGGGIGGYNVNPPAPGKEHVSMDWVVGQHDTWLWDQPTYSARRAAEHSESAYRGRGYANTNLDVVPSNHYNYDIPQILADGVKEMKRAVSGTTPQPAAPPVGEQGDGGPQNAPKSSEEKNLPARVWFTVKELFRNCLLYTSDAADDIALV